MSLCPAIESFILRFSLVKNNFYIRKKDKKYRDLVIILIHFHQMSFHVSIDMHACLSRVASGDGIVSLLVSRIVDRMHISCTKEFKSGFVNLTELSTDFGVLRIEKRS